MDYSFRYDRQLGLLLPDEKPAYSSDLVLKENHWSTDGLVACWLCNEDGGNTIFDLSGNRIHGTLISGPPWVVGKYGSALEFTAGADRVAFDASHPNIPVGAEPRTVEMLIYPTNVAAYKMFFSYGAALSGQGWTHEIGRNANGNVYLNGHIGAYILGPAAGLQANKWSSVVFSYDGDVVRIYIDGILGYTSGSIVLNTAGAAGAIGDRTYSTSYDYVGNIDHVYMWNRALADSEVAELSSDPFTVIVEEDLAWLYVTPPAVGVVPQIQWLRMNTL